MSVFARGLTTTNEGMVVFGEIDIVGKGGDSVSARRFAGLAVRVPLSEAKELASLAASIVVHQVGATDGFSVAQLRQLRCGGLQESSSVSSTKS